MTRDTRISFITFKLHFNSQSVFSLNDARKLYPYFENRRLNEWQSKGYIKKISNGWYLFSDSKISEMLLWWISNRIYNCSYISLESALSFYGFIPEGVFTTTGVTSRKTYELHSDLGAFTYRRVLPRFFFGYTVHHFNSWPIRVAEPEKALLDYLYLNPDSFSSILTAERDLIALRLNKNTIQETLNLAIIERYLTTANKAVCSRYKNFKEVVYA